MTVTLKRIAVSGFKSIREMDLELRSLNVLIGANGAGKSNFLGVFRLLNEIIEGRLGVYSRTQGTNSLLYFGAKATKEIDIKLDFGDVGYEAQLIPSGDDRLVFSEEKLRQNGITNNLESLYRPLHTPRYGETFLSVLPSEVVSSIVSPVTKLKVYHFQDTTPEARMKQTGDIDDNRYLRHDGANLAAYLYLLQERYKDYYDRIVRTIRLIAPFFDTFVLAPSQLNPDKIRLEWRERGSDNYFNVHALSDGTLRFICLATLLLQPEPPSLILIDEPELGLHPYALNYLAGIIRSVSTQTQIIVSTQSAALVDQFTPEDVIVVDREDRQSVFKRLASDDLTGWLEDYSLGELWEKNVLGGHRQPQEP